MKRVFDHLRDKIHQECQVPPLPGVSMEQLRRSEWSSEFEDLMRNRLVMGALRYGLMSDESKGKYDHMEAIIRKARQYRATGNDELLVDIANYALVEFACGRHPNKHFCATDDAGHCKAR